MNKIDSIRFSRRAEIDQQADRLYQLEYDATRPMLGPNGAREHAREIAASWRHEQYGLIERELED